MPAQPETPRCAFIRAGTGSIYKDPCAFRNVTGHCVSIQVTP